MSGGEELPPGQSLGSRSPVDLVTRCPTAPWEREGRGAQRAEAPRGPPCPTPSGLGSAPAWTEQTSKPRARPLTDLPGPHQSKHVGSVGVPRRRDGRSLGKQPHAARSEPVMHRHDTSQRRQRPCVCTLSPALPTAATRGAPGRPPHGAAESSFTGRRDHVRAPPGRPLRKSLSNV